MKLFEVQLKAVAKVVMHRAFDQRVAVSNPGCRVCIHMHNHRMGNLVHAEPPVGGVSTCKTTGRGS